VPISFLNGDVFFSITEAVGATVLCLEHDVKMPVLTINAAAMIDFFMGVGFFIMVFSFMNENN
jgi:hypothetical protein